MKLILILMTINILVTSCERTAERKVERPVKDIIDGGSYRYWRMHYTDKWDDLYYFDNRGHWTIFEGRKKNSHAQYTDFKEYNGGDNLLYKEWELINDSTIVYNGYQKAVAIEKDTIMFLTCENGTDTLYAVPKKRIPLQYRKKHFFIKYKTVYD